MKKMNDMYTKEHIKLLNKYGALTSVLIAKKDRCSFENAIKVMKAIVEDHVNVYFKTDDQIFIAGRESERAQPFRKLIEPPGKCNAKIKAYFKKKLKWKDVTKP